MSSSRKITLKSCDGESFEIDEAVAAQSQTVKNMMEDNCADNAIPLPNVDSKILSKVIEYCKKHVAAAEEKDIKKWDEEFVKVLDQAALFDLVQAANYLNVKNLLDLGCQAVADSIKDIMEPEELRKMFNIENDFTPEEEAAMRKESAWAFQN